jgi:hypothetical protein
MRVRLWVKKTSDGSVVATEIADLPDGYFDDRSEDDQHVELDDMASDLINDTLSWGYDIVEHDEPKIKPKRHTRKKACK